MTSTTVSTPVDDATAALQRLRTSTTLYDRDADLDVIIGAVACNAAAVGAERVTELEAQVARFARWAQIGAEAVIEDRVIPLNLGTSDDDVIRAEAFSVAAEVEKLLA